MNARLIYALPILVFAALAFYFGASFTKDKIGAGSGYVEKDVPDFHLESGIPGIPGLSKNDLQGEVSVITVFASWCMPCQMEHPVLMQLAALKRVRIFAINYKDKLENLQKFLLQHGNPFQRLGFDASGHVALSFGIEGVPVTFITDKRGKIRYKHAGTLTVADVEKTILAVVEKLDAEK